MAYGVSTNVRTLSVIEVDYTYRTGIFGPKVPSPLQYAPFNRIVIDGNSAGDSSPDPVEAKALDLKQTESGIEIIELLKRSPDIRFHQVTAEQFGKLYDGLLKE